MQRRPVAPVGLHIVVVAFALAASCSACGATMRPDTSAPAPPPRVEVDSFDPQRSLTCGTSPIVELPDDPTDAITGIDRPQLAAQLAGEGLIGWVHGAVPGFSQYVLTYRRPGDFFAHVEMSLVPGNDTVRHDQLPTLRRHDLVRVKGSFIANKAPIGHILVDNVEILEKYPGPVRPYTAYEATFPDDLRGITTIYGVVHAQVHYGGALVLEHKDAILPVFVSDRHRAAAARLYRGDIVKIRYALQPRPDQPTHVVTDDSVDNAVTVMDHLGWCHGRKATLTGALVLFPKSEQITIDVYALRHVDGNGMQRNWTLVNFDDPHAFKAIQDKAEAAWRAHASTAQVGRNQLINPRLRVTATGTMNVVSMSQANPQILLDHADRLTIEVVR